MNSPLEIREVRLRGLGGRAVCGVPRTGASATGSDFNCGWTVVIVDVHTSLRANMIPVYDSSGNVFQDMGMDDAEERLAKAEAARMIRTIARERGLEQEQLAGMLDLPQADVADLVRGRLNGFNLARLEQFPTALSVE
jgi:predicted XRE-type DNA-binding protein